MAISQIGSAGLAPGAVTLSTGVSGTLGATNGGTGLTTPGASGNVLQSNGSAWVSAAVPIRSGSTYATLSSGTPNITLTSSSNQVQVVTADAEGQSITLPNATTMTAGAGFFSFYNTSSYYVAIKDAGGTIREFLYPSASGSPIQATTLILQENADANGVWHIQNPISAGGSTDALFQTSTFNPGGTPSDLSVIQDNATQYVFLSYLTGYNNGATLRATLGTINLSTKAWTFGSTTTLYTNSGTQNFNAGVGGDSNGVDRGIIGAWVGTVNVGATATWQAWGFAIVSGTLYFSSATNVWSQAGITNLQVRGSTHYSGSNDTFIYWSSNYNSMYNGSLTAFKVNLASTTVTLAQCTGTLSLADSTNGPYWQMSPTTRTTFVIDRSNATSPQYASFNASTNTLTSGSRTSQTTQIAGNVMNAWYSNGNGNNIILNNSANTKLFLISGGTTCYTIANAGTATVTVATGATYNYKGFPSKAYSTQSTAFSFYTYYPVSSTSYQIYAANALLNCDPTNSNFNFNTASLGLPNASYYWTSSTQVVGVYLLNTTQIKSNVINTASPFIS